MLEIVARNMPIAYAEAWWKLPHHWVEQESRNGPVMTVPYPTILEIRQPCERVLYDPVRDANPFFHVMEFCWMMAGSNDAIWLSNFNKRMMEYADNGVLRGAYGWRWKNPTNQITATIDLLRRDQETRQAVLSMWDPVYDGPAASTSDRPCNTHIYFRVIDGKLDMTVCNRSNDLVWGMLGANAVHMTMLHEFIALAVELPVGVYRVMTNNLHVYKSVPRLDKMKETNRPIHYYDLIYPLPLLQGEESYIDFTDDCVALLAGARRFRTYWMQGVGYPMKMAYMVKDHRDQWIRAIAADDWRIAAEQWVIRRKQDLQSLQ